MKRFTRIVFAAVALAVASAQDAAAQLTWDWRFGTNSGTFTTTGSSTAAGSFTLLDFIVAASGDGATIGSMSGGQYTADGFCTNLPFNMDWNGSAVTRWDSGGCNSFDWWVFHDNGNSNHWIFFGWENGNINTTNQASYYDGPCCQEVSHELFVAPHQATTVPEPASMALLGTGLAALAAAKRRRNKK